MILRQCQYYVVLIVKIFCNVNNDHFLATHVREQYKIILPEEKFKEYYRLACFPMRAP